MGDPHLQPPPRISTSTMLHTSPRMLSHPPPSRPRNHLRLPDQRKHNHRTADILQPPLPTFPFETNWTSLQKTSGLEKIFSRRASFRIGRTTPPAPILATPMKCKKRTRLVRKYGSFIARPSPNCQIKSEWRT